MALDKFLMGILVFSVFLFSGIYLIADFNTQYGYTGVDISTSKFDNVDSNITDVYDITDTMQEKALEETSEDDIEQSMFKSALSTIKQPFSNVFSMSKVVGNTANAVAQELNLNQFYVQAILAALAIFVAITTVLLVLRIRG